MLFNRDMKHILSFLFFIFSLTVSAQTLYQPYDRQQVEKLLREAESMPRNTNWMMHFARKFYGTPYVGGTLDRDSAERLVVNLRELDCTTYVETVLALAICAKNGEKSFDDYCKHLTDVRYIDGKIDYVHRQHYFSIWIEDNLKQGLIKNVPQNSPPFSATQKLHGITYMTHHVSAYHMLSAHSEWLPGISKMEKSMEGKVYPYIPKTALRPSATNNKLLRNCIQDGDIIAILTTKKGLDTTHIGIASWHKDGLHLINASSVYKKVHDDPTLFYNYLMKNNSSIGIRVVRIK